MTYALGLDFGTTSTAAAVARDGVIRVSTLGNRSGAVPAVVFVRPDGSLLHGEEAFIRGGSEPLRLVRDLKRRLGTASPILVEGFSFDPADLVGRHLRWAVDKVAEQEGGPPDRIVLTHPTIWSDERIDGLRRALGAADLDPVLVAESHAAAWFHEQAHSLAVGELVGVYDLGGGTFDAAILRRTESGFGLIGRAEGEDHLGGTDFDDVVLHLVQSRLGEAWRVAQRRGRTAFDGAVAGLRRECVTAKESLSSEDSVEIPVVLPGLVTSIEVSRRELEYLVAPAVEESIGSFRRALSGAGIAPADLSAVLLVGGSCRLPIVRASLVKALGAAVPLLDADPQYAVARGAALVARSLLPDPPAWAPPAVAVVPSSEPTTTPPVRPTTSSGGPSPEPLPAPSWSRPTAGTPSEGKAGRPGRRSRLVLPLLLGAIVALIAVPVGWYLTREDASTSADAAIAKDDEIAKDAEIAVEGSDIQAAIVGVELPSGIDMVEVPAGTHQLGTGNGGPESLASYSATVEAFHIDSFEVTNGQYLAFVQQIGAPAPVTWERGVFPEAEADHAVTGVEFVWAEAYCVALEKRLPTENEWEAAARGPNGSLYPTGDTPDGLDLETGGGRAVGSVPTNISGSGAFDMVGGVWEWVGEPAVAIEGGLRVRRGGQYGRVRDGAAMRQAVDPNGQATISETGFRCAADAVDPSRPPLQFGIDHERPESSGTDAGPVGTGAGATGLVNDSFDDTGSGFADIDVGIWRVGYHSPSWYHLEATKPNVQVVSLGGVDLADGDVELSVYIDKLGTETGQYRYGLVFRSSSDAEDPPAGIDGPPRPYDFYAFVVNPRAGIWELLHKDELPLRVKLTGPLPVVRVTDPEYPDVLGVSMHGSEVVMSINGEGVGVFDTQGFHIGAGNLGLYTETFDETLVHAHFDLLTVN